MNRTILSALHNGLRAKSIGAAESGIFSRWGWNSPSYSGQSITIDTALQNDTVWACVKMISEAVSALPFFMYKKGKNGSRDVAPDHWLHDLIHRQPNEDMSAVTFWQAVVAILLVRGNVFIEKIKNDRGAVIALEVINPDFVHSTYDKVAGRYKHEYSHEFSNFGGRKALTKENCMHIKGFSLDGLMGMSAVQYGKNSIGSAIAADRASDDAFKNSSRATGVLNTGQLLKGDQREQIRGHVKKVAEAGGVYVLESGMKFESLKFSPADAELLASRSFSVETICRWFRVPPVMIGHGDKQSSWPTSTEAQGALFLRYVLRNIIVVAEQQLSVSMLSRSESAVYFAECSIEGLLRGDSKSRAEFYASGIQNAWLKPAEARAYENLPYDPAGDILMVQSSMLPVSQIGQNMLSSNNQSALKSFINSTGDGDA